jgi:hypothetical protein
LRLALPWFENEFCRYGCRRQDTDEESISGQYREGNDSSGLVACFPPVVLVLDDGWRGGRRQLLSLPLAILSDPVLHVLQDAY